MTRLMINGNNMEQEKPRRGRPRKGEIRPPKVKAPSRFGPGKERPQMWLIGEDAGSYKHSMYHPWQLSKAQANFRGEEWTLTFDDYYELWKDDWNNRGRLPDNKCMTRLDMGKGWTKKNTIILYRSEHLKRQGEQRRIALGLPPKVYATPRKQKTIVYKKPRI